LFCWCGQIPIGQYQQIKDLPIPDNAKEIIKSNLIDKNNPKKDVVDPQPIVINSAQSQAPVFIRTTNIKDKFLIQRININPE
jgi:hypothetical protein